ncbi:MAG: hypothetical protein JW860_07340, partial [Sedimentisphaerales bacterium]|nr:hypothetical protein [Sedimentisphaerales bacterium]
HPAPPRPLTVLPAASGGCAICNSENDSLCNCPAVPCPPIPDHSGPGTSAGLCNSLKQIMPPLNTGTAADNERNLFVATELFLSKLHLDQNPNPDSTPSRTILTDNLKLTGIMITDSNRWAMINDQVLFLNQSIGPFRLVDIQPESVALAAGQEKIILEINQKPSGPDAFSRY